ncbi:Eukaryotic initiation factor 4A-III, partial [Hypsibius exemplaris]
MKLLTHNMLTSKCIKGVQEGYPLRLKVENVEVKESDYNQEFIVRLLPKIRYDAIYSAAKDAGIAEDLPDSLPEDAATSEEFLRKLHHVLLEIEIMAGELVCPETGRIFPIQNGIPNMLLTAEESI